MVIGKAQGINLISGNPRRRREKERSAGTYSLFLLTSGQIYLIPHTSAPTPAPYPGTTR